MKFPNNGFFYELREGEAWWITPSEWSGVRIGQYVSILYDEEDYVLLKHGTPEHVNEQMARMQGALELSSIPGAQQMKRALRHTQIRIRGPYDIETVNRIIGTSGYLKMLLTGGERVQFDQSGLY